jgi:hypothetical protein
MKRVNKNREKFNFLGKAGKDLTYRGIKRKAIILGMPFPDATGNSIGSLLNFINNTPNKPDKSLIDKYDDWMDKRLEDNGYAKDDPMRNSRLRLGFLGEEENGSRKRKRIPGIKKDKKKAVPKEKDEYGLIKGTKKEYVWKLTGKGYTLDRIVRRTKKRFPEANNKSISLWYRTCKRYIKKHEEEAK